MANFCLRTARVHRPPASGEAADKPQRSPLPRRKASGSINHLAPSGEDPWNHASRHHRRCGRSFSFAAGETTESNKHQADDAATQDADAELRTDTAAERKADRRVPLPIPTCLIGPSASLDLSPSPGWDAPEAIHGATPAAVIRCVFFPSLC